MCFSVLWSGENCRLSWIQPASRSEHEWCTFVTHAQFHFIFSTHLNDHVWLPLGTRQTWFSAHARKPAQKKYERNILFLRKCICSVSFNCRMAFMLSSGNAVLHFQSHESTNKKRKYVLAKGSFPKKLKATSEDMDVVIDGNIHLTYHEWGRAFF